MKPETKEWLDKLVPLLAHLKDGGKVSYVHNNKQYEWPNVPYLLDGPHLYTIHVEPRVIYVQQRNDGLLGNYSVTNDPPTGINVAKHRIRFVEDLNWKPDQEDLDGDHHLPEPSISNKATDYQSTI
jgi:hypothetical protein